MHGQCGSSAWHSEPRVAMQHVGKELPRKSNEAIARQPIPPIQPVTIESCVKDSRLWHLHLPDVADRYNQCLGFVKAQALVSISVKAIEVLLANK
jgi:hypothetical protein